MPQGNIERSINYGLKTWDDRLKEVRESTPELLKREPFNPTFVVEHVDGRVIRKNPDIVQINREFGIILEPKPSGPSLLQRIRNLLHGLRTSYSRTL